MQNENNLYDDERFGVYNAFIDINEIKPKTLTTTQITILSVLWRSINNQKDNPLKGKAWISQEKLRVKCGISSDTTYYKHFKPLINAGWIIQEKRFNDTSLYQLKIPKDIYDLLVSRLSVETTDNTVSTKNGGTVSTKNGGTVSTLSVELKEKEKINIKDKYIKEKEEAANAPLSPDGDFKFISILLKNLNIKENDKNKRLITNRIKNKDSLSYIEKIINSESDFYGWVNTKEYTCDAHKLNTALKYILDEADKRYNKNNPCNNTLFYGRYTKEEVDNFRLNLSMGEMYPELLEFIQIEQNYDSF